MTGPRNDSPKLHARSRFSSFASEKAPGCDAYVKKTFLATGSFLDLCTKRRAEAVPEMSYLGEKKRKKRKRNETKDISKGYERNSIVRIWIMSLLEK